MRYVFFIELGLILCFVLVYRNVLYVFGDDVGINDGEIVGVVKMGMYILGGGKMGRKRKVVLILVYCGVVY